MVIREMMKEYYKHFKEGDLKKIDKDVQLKLPRL